MCSKCVVKIGEISKINEKSPILIAPEMQGNRDSPTISATKTATNFSVFRVFEVLGYIE